MSDWIFFEYTLSNISVADSRRPNGKKPLRISVLTKFKDGAFESKKFGPTDPARKHWRHLKIRLNKDNP